MGVLMRSSRSSFAVIAALAVLFSALPAFGWMREHYSDWDVATRSELIVVGA